MAKYKDKTPAQRKKHSQKQLLRLQDQQRKAKKGGPVKQYVKKQIAPLLSPEPAEPLPPGRVQRAITRAEAQLKKDKQRVEYKKAVVAKPKPSQKKTSKRPPGARKRNTPEDKRYQETKSKQVRRK